jgi:acyl-CoA thioesterase-1
MKLLFTKTFLICLSLLLTTAQAYGKTVLVVGDSISAGYGIELEQGWVNLLREKISKHGDYVVHNASVSGDTTQIGASRLPTLLKEHKPDIVVIELGGNDGLRGFPLKVMEANLRKMTEAALATDAKVLLVGIQIPPNYGPRYTEEFFQIYFRVAEDFEVPLVPFILDKVALEPELMQDDGIHPTAEGQPQLLDNVWPFLEPLL